MNKEKALDYGATVTGITLGLDQVYAAIDALSHGWGNGTGVGGVGEGRGVDCVWVILRGSARRWRRVRRRFLGVCDVVVQVLTEYVRRFQNERPSKDALAKEDIDVLGDALARERGV